MMKTHDAKVEHLEHSRETKLPLIVLYFANVVFCLRRNFSHGHLQHPTTGSWDIPSVGLYAVLESK